MAVELHVDDGAHDLADATDYVGCHVASHPSAFRVGLWRMLVRRICV